MNKKLKLFGVYLGGRVENCNIEAHDFVFSVGEDIESLFEDLKNKWHGLRKGLHIDSWVELTHVDGYDIFVCNSGVEAVSDMGLYFINAGGYIDKLFCEVHRNTFVVASSEKDARSVAKNKFERELNFHHVDGSYMVDDCIKAAGGRDYSIVLSKSQKIFSLPKLKYNNGLIKIKCTK